MFRLNFTVTHTTRIRLGHLLIIIRELELKMIFRRVIYIRVLFLLFLVVKAKRN